MIGLMDIERIRRLLIEVDDINKDMTNYNHYWRKYTITVFASYIPQILFELYICLYFEITTAVLVFSIILNVNIIALISQICVFSARVIKKVWSGSAMNQ